MRHLFPDESQERRDYNYNFDADISRAEFMLAIRSLKGNKAVGIDDLPAEVLKRDNLLDTLHAFLINVSLQVISRARGNKVSSIQFQNRQRLTARIL